MKKYSKEEAKRLLEKSEGDKNCFAAIFKRCPQPMSILSTDGCFIKPNEALCTFLEYSFSELQNKTFYDITHPEDLTAELKELERLLDNEIDHFVLFNRFITKGGRIAPTLLTLFKVNDEEGNLMYYVSHVVPVRNGAENNIKKWVFEHDTEKALNIKEKIGLFVVDNWKFVFTLIVAVTGVIYLALDFRDIVLDNYEIQRQLLDKLEHLRN